MFRWSVLGDRCVFDKFYRILKIRFVCRNYLRSCMVVVFPQSGVMLVVLVDISKLKYAIEQASRSVAATNWFNVLYGLACQTFCKFLPTFVRSYMRAQFIFVATLLCSATA